MGSLRQRAPVLGSAGVAAGTTEAATAHIKAVAARLALVNRQLRQAHDRLDRLTERLAASGDAAPGQTAEQRDVTILASLPGVGRIVLATLLAEAFDPLQRRDYPTKRRDRRAALKFLKRTMKR